MDAPAYNVTVSNLTRAWTVTATHDPDLVAEDLEAIATLPTAPLRFTWGFVDDLIPNPTDPDRVTFGLWSRTAADEPTLDQGDVLAWTVRLGAAGPVIANGPVFRVTEVSTDLVPGDDWAVRTTVTAASVLADLHSAFPNYDGVNGFYAHRWGLIGKSLGLSIGCPTTWSGDADGGALNPDWIGSSSATTAAELLASYVPGGVHHALIPYYGAGYPPGYHYVDQGYSVPVEVPGPVPDPGTTLKLLIVPAGRQQTTTYVLPLAFYDNDGTLDLLNNPDAGTAPMPAVSSRFCEVPATARRTREHLINTVIIKGVNIKSDGSESRPSTYTHANAADVAARGPIARTIDTQLVLRYYDTDPEVPGPLGAHIPAIAASFLALPSSTLAYKEFIIRGSDMPQPVAEAVLPHITPSYPGDGRDGRLVRHLTVHSLPEAVRLPDAQQGGFITAGELTIDQGQLVLKVSTTPGEPTYLDGGGVETATPMTVGEFLASPATDGLVLPDVEPTITLADLDLVD